MKRFAICLSLVSCGLSLPAHAAGFYTKVGILGAGLGYFTGGTDHLSLRADFTTVNKFKHKFKRDFTSGAVDYRANLDADQWGIYSDFFPFGNGFRLSGGVHMRKLQAQAQGRPNANGEIVIGTTPVEFKFDAGDTLTGQVTFPKISPYVGIGWGYHDSQKTGLGFVFDLGVSFGKPSASLTISDSLQKKLDRATNAGVSAADELESQRQKLNDTVGKFKVFPQIYAGISYRF